MASGIWQLADLPVDIWSVIVDEHLSVNDLVTLKLAGNHSVWQKLSMPGVVKHLKLETDFPMSKAPFRFLLEMPHLRTLDLTLSSTSSATRILMQPLSRTTSLHFLSLHWFPEHYGRRWPSWSPSALPRSLHTFHSNLPIYDQDFVDLPRHLTSLELTRLESVTGEGFAFLPPSLAHLRLYVTSDVLLSLTQHLQHLPSSLTSLELPYLAQISPLFLSQLPKNLLLLNLSRVHILDNDALGLLPRGLTHLNIKATTTLTDTSILHFPPRLASLCLQPNEENSRLTADAVRHMPSTITSFAELPRVMQREYARLYLNRQLEGFDWESDSGSSPSSSPGSTGSRSGLCASDSSPSSTRSKEDEKVEIPRWVASNVTDDLIHLLPPQLHSLNLSQNRVITEHGILRVPIELESLVMPNFSGALSLDASLIKYLPRSLKELELPHVSNLTEAHLSDLPPQLTRLKLCVGAESAPFWGSQSLKFLPRTLKYLQVPSCLLQQIEINSVLFMLPSSCQQITFGSGPGSVVLRRDSTFFLRDTLKLRYLTTERIQLIFDEILRPVASILGLVLVTHLLYTYRQFKLIPFAIAIVPTFCSSLLFVLQRYLDSETSLFSWRPSTSIIIPQLIIFACYSFLYLLTHIRPRTPW